MKITLTRLGLPELVVYPGAVILVMAVLAWIMGLLLPIWVLFLTEGLLLVVLIWLLSFFRDPERICPEDDQLLLAPADGRVTDVVCLQDQEPFKGNVLKISIFLSIFNVHINRMPCQVTVEKTSYKPGRFKNAMNPDSSRTNESNTVFLKRCTDPEDTLLVRQISGAIAKRIVCPVTKGQRFRSGEKFGMIKFGSRTELYVPARDNLVCCTRVGDRVKAGLSVLARYTDMESSTEDHAKGENAT